MRPFVGIFVISAPRRVTGACLCLLLLLLLLLPSTTDKGMVDARFLSGSEHSCVQKIY
jgi:hypothetical protein